MPSLFTNAFEDEQEITEALLEGSALVQDFACSAIGPAGRHKIIQANRESGASTVTTTSIRMLQGISWAHPAVRLLVEASAVAQHRACADGGLLSACLASRLTQDALRADPGLTFARHRWIRGWQTALRWALEALGQRLLEDDGDTDVPKLPSGRTSTSRDGDRERLAAARSVPLALPLKWSDMGSVTALVRSVVTPKLAASGLSRYEAELLVNVAARAFICAIGEDPRVPPVVRVLCLEGHPVSNSRCVEALLLDSPLAPEDRAKLPISSRASVAVFLCSLDVSAQAEVLETAEGQATQRSIEIVEGSSLSPSSPSSSSPSSAPWDPAGAQLEALEDLVEELSAAGVGVLASQRTIHPRIRAACRASGVLALERLSARHVGAFCRAAGATPMGTRSLRLVPGWRRHLGRLGALEALREGGQDLLLVAPAVAPQQQQEEAEGQGSPRPLSAAAPVSTILLGGPNDLVLQEMRSCLEAAMQVLSRALRVQMVTPGGGCAEVVMAHRLRAQSSASFGRGSQEASAVESLCLALEDAAGRLSGGLACPRELVEVVRDACLDSSSRCAAAALVPPAGVAAHSHRASLYGWDHFSGQVKPVVQYEFTLPPGAAAAALATSEDLLVHRVGNAWILDSLPGKAFALSSALEAACMVCRLSGAVLAGDA